MSRKPSGHECAQRHCRDRHKHEAPRTPPNVATAGDWFWISLETTRGG